jgi:hypothetical protein
MDVGATMDVGAQLPPLRARATLESAVLSVTGTPCAPRTYIAGDNARE